MSATLCKQPCPERKAPLQTLEKAGLLFGVGGLVCEGGSGRPLPSLHASLEKAGLLFGVGGGQLRQGRRACRCCGAASGRYPREQEKLPFGADPLLGGIKPGAAAQRGE